MIPGRKFAFPTSTVIEVARIPGCLIPRDRDLSTVGREFSRVGVANSSSNDGARNPIADVTVTSTHASQRNKGITVMTMKRNNSRLGAVLLSGFLVLPATFASAQSNQPAAATPPAATAPQADPSASGMKEHKMMGDHQMMDKERMMSDDKMKDNDKKAGMNCCAPPGQMAPTTGMGGTGSSDTKMQPAAPATTPMPMKDHM